MNHSDYVTARCTSCGQQVEGTVTYLLNVHVPMCRQIQDTSRRAFYAVPWSDGGGGK